MTGNLEGGATTFPQANAVWRTVFDPGKMAPVGCVREEFSTGTLNTVTSAHSLEPHNPICFCTMLVHTELPCLFRVQGEWL